MLRWLPWLCRDPIITADRLLLKKRLNASLFYKVEQKVEKKYLPRLFIVEEMR